MKIYPLLILCTLILGITILQSCNNPVSHKNKAEVTLNDTSGLKPDQIPNTLSEQEKTEGWVLLFDGKSTVGWRAYLRDSFPENRWDISDESLHCKASNGEEHVAPEDIISNKLYKDFEFALDWKIREGGNSGIYFLANEKSDVALWKQALKMQLIDNANDEADLGKNGDRKSGALFDILPVSVQNTRRPGQWNQVRIIVSDGRVEFFQNSEKILEFELWTDDWNQLINKSRFKVFADMLTIGGPDKNGHIGFQDARKEVWFRNIKIRTME